MWSLQSNNRGRRENVYIDEEKEENKNILQGLYELNSKNWFLNPDEDLQSLAQKLKISPHAVSKAINQEYQINFNQYINQLRVEYMVEIIKEQIESKKTLPPIEELYLSAGFNSKSTFNRHFKRILGMTPTEFIHNLEGDTE